MFLKGVIHELLWFLRGDTNIKYLVDNGVHIWDNDAYRHYNELCVRHGVPPVGRETFLASAGVESPIEGYRFGDLNHVYGYQWRSWPRPDGGVVDQIAQAAGLIRTNPESRRIVVSAWNVAEIDAMALPPCHVLFQFYVAGGRLSCQLYQRSADTFLGVPFNIASYALLTCMMAQVCGLQPGEFIHTLGDTHLYLNHLEQVDEQLSREPRPLPKLRLNPAVKSVFDFRYEDFTLEGYDPWPAIKAPDVVFKPAANEYPDSDRFARKRRGPCFRSGRRPARRAAATHAPGFRGAGHPRTGSRRGHRREQGVFPRPRTGTYHAGGVRGGCAADVSRRCRHPRRAAAGGVERHADAVRRARVELLRELGKRCPVYLLSNTNLPHRIRFRESFRERFGGSFDELFVRCFYSDELHLRKPDPEIYRSVARQIGTPPGKLLFIDDNAANVSAARGEGWQACHLTGGITVTDLFEL